MVDDLEVIEQSDVMLQRYIKMGLLDVKEPVFTFPNGDV